MLDGLRLIPHTHINIQTCSLFLSLHASTGKEDTIDNKIQKKPNNIRQDELEAPWRTCSGGLVKNKRKKNLKKEGKEPLYPLYGPIREGKGFWVTPCRMGEGGARHLRAGEGWANQRGPTCQSQSDGVKIKTVEVRGERIYRKKVVGKEGGCGLFKRKRLPTAFILLLV